MVRFSWLVVPQEVQREHGLTWRTSPILTTCFRWSLCHNSSEPVLLIRTLTFQLSFKLLFIVRMNYSFKPFSLFVFHKHPSTMKHIFPLTVQHILKLLDINIYQVKHCFIILYYMLSYTSKSIFITRKNPQILGYKQPTWRAKIHAWFMKLPFHLYPCRCA